MKKIIVIFVLIVLCSCTQDIEVKVIQECEYIHTSYWWAVYGQTLAHKGNCKNEYHNNKKNK